MPILGSFTSGSGLTTASGSGGGANGSSAANAAESAKQIKTDFPSSTSGVYWLKPVGYGGSAFQVYCDMSNDGGGWTHIMSINTSDGTERAWADTSFWQGDNTVGSASAPWNTVKSQAFSALTDFTQLLMISYSGSGTYRGHARWTFTNPYNTTAWSFRNIMNIANSTTASNVVTGTRQVQSGQTTGATRNNARGQGGWGCQFVDNGTGAGAAICVNWSAYGGQAKYSAWGDTRSDIRFTTTYFGSGYGHTYGGALGGYHERPSGSYPATYEYEPVHAYCDPPYHYGTDSASLGSTTGYCGQGSVLDRSIAIFVK